jgi:hypothetical protein
MDDLLEQKSMKKLVRVGGVPEHFNLAWHLAYENGLFSKEGIDIQWQDVPGGTGAMCKALRDGDLDIAITLTEGIVADIMAGNPSRIIQFYVNSPLRWGIYTGINSGITSLDQINGKKYAISRYRSGSHLMAFVNKTPRAWSFRSTYRGSAFLPLTSILLNNGKVTPKFRLQKLWISAESPGSWPAN